MLNPAPGPMIRASRIARPIAQAVVNRYNPKDLPPTRPSTRMSPMPVTPVSRLKNTSGTTSILSALTNILPIIANRPPTIWVSMKAEFIMSKMTPSAIPAPMAIMIFVVRDILPPVAAASDIASLPI